MATNSAATLTALPTELLLRIMANLVPNGSLIESHEEEPHLNPLFLQSRVAFANLCRTSRRLHDIARNFLFQVVILRNPHELSCFFRTLVLAPNLRVVVQSVAWFGLSCPAYHPQHHPSELEPILSEYIPIRWPASEVEHAIAHLTLMPDNQRPFFSVANVLGAVLASCPNIRWLFVRLTNMEAPSDQSTGDDHNGDLPGRYVPLEFFSFQDILTKANQPQAIATTVSSHRPLQGLETLVIEPYSLHRVGWEQSSLILRLVLTHCPSLKWIEVKEGESWQAWLRNEIALPPLVRENVRGLLALRATSPRCFLTLATTFPALTSLTIEFQDGSLRGPPSLISPDQLCGALLSLRNTLRTLHITTTPGNSWRRSTSPAFLSAVLKRMQALRRLTTEAVWLFPQSNDVATLQLAALLPTSLVNLHLIDYWGISDRDTFYQRIPFTLSPLQCMELLFSDLHDKCGGLCLPGLRNVDLISSRFGELAELDKVRSFISRYQGLFIGKGVDLFLIPLEDWRAQLQQSWACIA